MARQETAGSDIGEQDTAFAAPADYTFFVWVKGDLAPSQAGVDFPIEFHGTSLEEGFSWSHSSSSFVAAAFHRQSNGTYKTAQLTTTLSTATWYAIATTYNSTSDELKVYLDGDAEVVTTTGVTSSNTNDGHLSPWLGSQDDGLSIAWLTMWNAVLSQSEINSLARRMVPIRIRNPSILRCFPMRGESPEQDYSSVGDTMTMTGTVVVDNSPVGPWFGFDEGLPFAAAAPPAAGLKGPLGMPLCGALGGPI